MFDPKDLQMAVQCGTTVNDLRGPAFATIARMDNVHPAAQIRALALALTVCCDATGVSAHDLVSQSYRMMGTAEADYFVHIQAIREYAANELVRRPKA